jgi:purine catabolism regulator
MPRGRHTFVALLEAAAAQDDLREQARIVLAPLAAYDSDHGGDLLQTLRTYFICNGNASKSAERLFLHRNGLLYRLARVEELIGASLSDGEVRLGLEIALRLAGAAD